MSPYASKLPHSKPYPLVQIQILNKTITVTYEPVPTESTIKRIVMFNPLPHNPNC